VRVGLRIDVDTFRGTKIGVPNLSRLLAERDLLATFFFSVGPDNMGRHLWRLLRPGFLWKMLRSNAPGLYGWDILLRGTLWPGPRIGARLPHVLRDTAAEGHEIGFHAWDHHAWQAHVARWGEGAIERQVRRGVAVMTEILGRPPRCSAAPAWRCTDRVLAVKGRFPFEFNSDCRGRSVFTPVVPGSGPLQPQIPVTLPTYDELVGRQGMDADGYYREVESLLDRHGPNVLAIHAEVEGIGRLGEFQRFLDSLTAHGWSVGPLGALADEAAEHPPGRIEKTTVPGRDGWVSRQVVEDRP
jgi:undecaprenyl phosphate-alpha-L-ara4FN deformylase